MMTVFKLLTFIFCSLSSFSLLSVVFGIFFSFSHHDEAGLRTSRQQCLCRQVVTLEETQSKCARARERERERERDPVDSKSISLEHTMNIQQYHTCRLNACQLAMSAEQSHAGRVKISHSNLIAFAAKQVSQSYILEQSN
jgi:hypothetical protein